MATKELVREKISVGANLIQALDEDGVEVKSAFWLYDAVPEEWKLIISMPLVDQGGIKSAFEAVSNALQRSGLRGIFLREIAPVSPRDQTATLLKQVINTGPGIYSIRFSNNTIGNVVIEDAYIYRSS